MEHMIFGVGVLGNIISFMVYLAPIPTFCRICKKKSTEGFMSLPYVVALFSAMLWIYYAFLKKDNVILLITINALGCFIESLYISMYLVYASRIAKVYTVKLIVLLIIGLYGIIIIVTMSSTNGSKRVGIVGWICVGCAVCVFVAPLCVIKRVFETKSVKFMPFLLSLSLTLSAVAWLFYGLLSNDKFVWLPNTLGIFFGVVQMVLYLVYEDWREIEEETKDPEHVITIHQTVVTPKSEVFPINLVSDGREKLDDFEVKINDEQEEIELSHLDIV